MNQEIKLNEGQKEYKKTIIKCIAKEMTTLEAAMELCLHRRTIQIAIKRYKQKGDLAFIHGNTGKKHYNEANEKRKQKIIEIFLNEKDELGRRIFEDVSYAFCAQMMNDDYDYDIKCSPSLVKNILNGIGYFTPERHKIKKKKSHSFRERKECFGELIQADGTSFDWFGDGKQYCIQGFMDDATSKPCGLYMTRNECLLGYVEAFRMMANEYGIPDQLYPDRASVFFTTNKKSAEKNPTQFGMMMEKLGVDMFPAYSPEAKGRIERFWGTVQKQLPKLFRRYNIRTIDAANVFLRDVYRKRFAKHYGIEAKSLEKKFVKASSEQINSILILRYDAKTDKGGRFSFKGYRLYCPELTNQKIHIYLSEREGIFVSPITKKERHEIKVLETDTSGSMPQVMQDLFEKTLLKNAKPRYKEVYLEVDDVAIGRFSQRAKSA